MHSVREPVGREFKNRRISIQADEIESFSHTNRAKKGKLRLNWTRVCTFILANAQRLYYLYLIAIPLHAHHTGLEAHDIFPQV